MFEFAGKWIDGRFIAFRDWLDRKLVPAWRVWWKLTTMRLGILFAALMTYIAAAPQEFMQALNALPDWMRHSLPEWIGPLSLAVLFFARFWDQTAKINPPAPPAPPAAPEIHHGAE
jgi:hypothetical protein